MNSLKIIEGISYNGPNYFKCVYLEGWIVSRDFNKYIYLGT